MKKLLNNIAILSVVLLSFISCETDQIDTYIGNNNIYFTYAESGGNFSRSGKELRDSIGYSFALTKSDVQQMLIQVPISVQGIVSSQEREVNLIIDDASTAIEGTHFEIPNQILFKAGAAVDNIPITFFRTSELKTENLSLVLRLEPNKYFSTDFKTKIFNNDTLNLVKLKISINDILEKPSVWFDFYLGSFSSKKMSLMSEILDFDPSIFDANAPVFLSLSKLNYFAVFTQNYLNVQEANGNTVFEEDGSPMIMGPGVQ